MAPWEIRNALVRQLGQTRRAMLKPKYRAALRKLPAPERRSAALQLAGVQIAYVELRTAQLADIREDLVANEGALRDGIASLKKALKSLQKTKAVVKATGDLLKAVGRIVPLI